MAHYIEEEGLATTQISLVRLHTEKIKPPRALWVPYELGRPLGQPNDPEFQKRVLRACLGLLDAAEGPVLEDYPEDVPAEARNDDMTGMFCPIDLPPPPLDDSEQAQGLLAEIGRIAPWYEMAVGQRNRTTVGISELDIPDAACFVADFIDDPSTSSPREGLGSRQQHAPHCTHHVPQRRVQDGLARSREDEVRVERAGDAAC